MTIVRDEEILGGEPRVAGSRVGVRHIARNVVDSGQSPAYVADQFDMPISAVYEAVAYYYENLEEIKRFERANGEAFDRISDESLKPKEPIS
jgi:uncharacterized protein (DUF433 family)